MLCYDFLNVVISYVPIYTFYVDIELILENILLEYLCIPIIRKKNITLF